MVIMRGRRLPVWGGAWLFSFAVHAAVDLSLDGVYHENCDGLLPGLPQHWLADGKGTPAGPVEDDGGNATGALYSYGAKGHSERAIGSLASGSLTPIRFGVVLRNACASNVTGIAVSFAGEQWRSGTGSATNLLQCRYATLPNAPTNLADLSSWTACPPLTLASLVAGAGCALDGNAASNRAILTANIAPCPSLPSGHYLALWWVDADEGGADHGLAVDDLSVQWTALAPPAPVQQLLAFWHCNQGEEAGTLDRLLPLGTLTNQTDYYSDAGAMTAACLHAWSGLHGTNGGNGNHNFGLQTGSINNWPECVDGKSAGYALAVSGQTNNCGFIELRFDRAVSNCLLTYTTSGTGTGYTNLTYQASTNCGLDWIACGQNAAVMDDTYEVRTNVFADVFMSSCGPTRNRIRIVLDGASRYDGKNRLDNLQLTGAIPWAFVNLQVEPPDAGTAIGGGWHEAGAEVTVSATNTRPGCCFGYWSDGIGRAERNVTVPAGGLLLIARFFEDGSLMIVR
ncbi:MAG: hypothetical protein PHR35_05015 [Kiritimatiellae bacterium]|nr:hypothetical protein [Kiritimatiellia bacterium]